MAPPNDSDQTIAHPQFSPASALTWIFRIVRWSTYLAALITLILILHKTPPPVVETSPQAAARAEEKFQEVEKSVAQGQPATMRLDSAELNSYLASHLELQGIKLANAAPTGGSGAPSAEDVEQVRSNVRDVKVDLVGDRVRAYIVINVHGKDLSLQLEGHLGSENGYLRFEPVGGQIGSMPLPQSALQSAVQKMMDSAANREKLKLPPEISALRIENGEVVASYR